jgi:hypothetical protein
MLGYCRILSENQISNFIAFTIAAYKKPANFDLEKIYENSISLGELKTTIEKVDALSGRYFKQITYPIDCKEIGKKRLTLNLSSTEARKHVVGFLDSTCITGKVLRLGCAAGINRCLFLDKKQSVGALDNSKLCLENLSINTNDKRANLKIKKKDFSMSQLTRETSDIALAIDSLPDKQKNDPISLFRKIQSPLKPGGGIFIETLFLYTKYEQAESNQIQFMKKNRSHFIKNGFYPRELFKHTRFPVETTSLRFDEPIVTGCFVLKGRGIYA